MSDIEFNCPHCDGSLVVDAEGAGTTVDCPRCSKPIQIPSPRRRRSAPAPGRTVECPYCKEEIKEGAIKCKHCGSNLASDVPQANASAPISPVREARQSAGSIYNTREVQTIAGKQKLILWLILAYFLGPICLVVGVALAPDPSQLTEIAKLALYLWVVMITVCCMVFAYQLAAALKLSVPWLFPLLMLIPFPCAGLIGLLVLNHKASKALRSMGIRVGLLGASRADLRKQGEETKR